MKWARLRWWGGRMRRKRLRLLPYVSYVSCSEENWRVGWLVHYTVCQMPEATYPGEQAWCNCPKVSHPTRLATRTIAGSHEPCFSIYGLNCFSHDLSPEPRHVFEINMAGQHSTLHTRPALAHTFEAHDELSSVSLSLIITRDTPGP